MKKRWMASFIMAAVLVCWAAAAGAFAQQGFSADIVSYAGKETMTGKIFVARDKTRFETAGMVTITRMDKKVVWMLMPTEKMYMEQAIRADNIVPSAEPVAGEVERTLLGTEAVNGQAANKYRVTVQAEGRKTSMYHWLAVDSGLPLKIGAIDGSWWQEYRNIKVGEPDAAFFELPDGYRKFAMGM